MVQSSRVHLVSGATGFVGAAIVLELLARTEDSILTLVRPGPHGAQERINDALLSAARVYGIDLGTVALHRVRGIAGDVTLPDCGVDSANLEADLLWHCAASLKYENRHVAEIMATNVDGTRNMLELARSCGVRVVNMTSTAYVAGAAEGKLYEQAIVRAEAQNEYERSKIKAEAISRDTRGMQVRILRPSIVVGHSRTLAATAFTGLYGFVRQMIEYRHTLEGIQPGLYREQPIKIRVSPKTTLNLVPVDVVAAEAVHIGLSEEAVGVYHLTGTEPPLVADTISMIADQLGFIQPEFVDDAEPLGRLDRALNKRLDFYSSYLQGYKDFDRSRTMAVVGRKRTSHPQPSDEALVRWYIAHQRSPWVDHDRAPASRRDQSRVITAPAS